MKNITNATRPKPNNYSYDFRTGAKFVSAVNTNHFSFLNAYKRSTWMMPEMGQDYAAVTACMSISQCERNNSKPNVVDIFR